MSLKKVTNYLSNVGRSMEYAAIDVLKDTSPSIASFAETNRDISMAVATGVRDHKTLVKSIDRTVRSSDLYKAAEQAKRSVFEDIRSGNFYNNARKDAIDAEILGFGDDWDDMDDGFSWDDDESYDDDDGGISASDEISKAVSQSSHTSTMALSNTIAGVAEYSVESQRAISNSQILAGVHNTSKIIDQLLSINTNIISARDMDQAHISIGDNAKRYYEESIDLKKQDNAMLKELLEMQRNLYNRQAEESSGSKQLRYDDVVDFKGIPNLKEYMKLVGKNIQDKTSSISGMGDMFEGGNIWMSFASSPLEFIPKYLISQMMSSNLDKSIKGLDKSMSGFFSALTTRFNEMASDNDGNIITQTIGEIFGIRNTLNTKINTSKYNKEAVPWDGKARQALIEVIPAYLAQLVALQSGQSERLYDYDKGKFIEAKTIQEEYKNMIASSAHMATSDFRYNMMDRFEKSFTFTDPNRKKEFEEDMTTFLEYFFNNEKVFDYKNKDSYDYEGLNLSNRDNYNIIKDLFKTMPKNMQLDFYREIMSGRSSLEDSIRSMESEGDSIYRYLGNDSGVGKSFDEKGRLRDNVQGVNSRLSIERDVAGHTIFDYLSKITSTLLEGIIVYPIGGSATGTDGGPGPLGDHILSRSTRFSDNDKYNEAAMREKYKPTMSDSEIESFKKNANKRIAEHGLMDIDSLDSEADIASILERDAHTKSIEDAAKPKKIGFMEEMLGATSLYKKGVVATSKIKGVLNKPQDMIADVLNRVDNRLFELIYGSGDENDENKADGFMELMIMNMKDTFSAFNDWLDKSIFEPLGNKSSALFEGILQKLGIDVDERGVMRSIRNHIFGETDEDGEYVKRGILTDTMEKVRGDLSKAKSYVFGRNRTLRGIANLLKEYSMDYTLWNTYDQLNVLHEIQKRISIFGSMDLEDRKIYKRIKDIIEKTTDENVADSLLDINGVLIDAEYSTGDKSLWGSLKSSIGITKDKIFGTGNEIDKIGKIITDRDLFKPKFNNFSDPSKVNPMKFQSIYRFLQEYVFLDITDMAAKTEELSGTLDRIDPSNNEEISLKDDLIKLFKSGVQSGKYKKMSMDMLSLLGTRAGIKSVRNVISMMNKFDTNDAIAEGTKGLIGPRKLDGSYADGLYEVKGEEEIVAVHKGERILTSKDAKDFNPIIDSLQKIRDGETSGNVEDRLMSDIDKLLGRFTPKTKEEGAMKAKAVNEMNKYTSGDKTMDDVLDAIAKVIGVELENPDSIKPEDTLVNRIKIETSNQFSQLNKLLFGTNTTDSDEIGEEMEVTMGDILKDIGSGIMDYVPKGISGAMLGGAAGLLPGMIGGPLAWATIGAGASIISHSDTMMEALFGKKDDEGDRVGGMIPKDVINGIEKFAPGMAKGGALGAAAALMPFTPFGLVGGLTLGATTSLVTKSDTFKDLMFGDEDSLFGPDGEEKIKEAMTKAVPGAGIGGLLGAMTLGGPLGIMGGALLGGAGSFALGSDTFKKAMFGDDLSDDGLISQDMQKRLKQVLPASAIATIGIGALGPFGILGSTVLGAATGIATTSDHFKDAIFGEPDEDGKRDGGFVGAAKKKMNDFFDKSVKEPFQDALAPIKHEMSEIGKSIKESISNSINSVFEAAIGMPLGEMVRTKIIEPFTKMTQKFFGGIGKILGGIIASPFRALKWIGDNLRDKHEKEGVVYGSDKDGEPETMMTMLADLDDIIAEEKEGSAVSKVTNDIEKHKESVSGTIPEDEDEPKLSPLVDVDDIEVLPKFSGRESNDEREGALSDNTASDTIKGVKNPVPEIDNPTVEKTKDESDEEEKDRKKRKKTNDYIKDIRDEVHGQLDGLGYNVEKIKNILVNNLGDADATGMETGRGNRKRKGILGRVIDLLSAPLEFFKNIKNSIVDSLKGAFENATDVIMAPFRLFGKAMKGLTSGLNNIKNKAMEVIGGIADFMGNIAKTLGNVTLNIIDGLGKASVHLLEGVGMLGKELLGFAGKLPDMLASVIKTGANIAKGIGKGIGKVGSVVGKGISAIGRGVGAGFDSLFNRDKEGKSKKMEVTIVGGKLDEVEVVNVVKQVGVHDIVDNVVPFGKPKPKVSDVIPLPGEVQENEDGEEVAVAGMPTPFGMISFMKDFEGKMVPVKDKIYEMFNKDTKKRDEEMAKMAESTKRSAEADEDTADSVSIFKDDGGGNKKKGGILGSIFNTLKPLSMLLVPLIPKLAGLLGGKLDDLLPEGKAKDTMMEPITNISEKSKSGLAVRAMAKGATHRFRDNTLTKVALRGVENAPQALSTISKTISKIFTNEKVIAMLTKILPDSGANIASSIATKIAPQIAEQAGEAGAIAIAGKMATNAFVVIAIGLVIKDFASGMSRAEEILKMDGDLPIKFKVIAGLANALNNRITFGFVPINWLLNILIKLVGSKEERQDITNAQKKLTQGYESYKQKELASGKTDKEIMSFEEFNVDTNAGFIRRQLNKRKSNKRIKKNKRKQDKVIEEATESSEGYGFGLFRSRETEDYNIEEHGCGAKALRIVGSNLFGDDIDEDEMFDDSLSYMHSRKGLDPQFFAEYAKKKGTNIDIYKGNSGKLRTDIKNPDLILSTNIDGKQHYMVTGGMRDGKVELIDPDTNESILMDIKDTIASTNFAVKMKGNKPKLFGRSKNEAGNVGLRDIISNRKKMEESKQRSESGKGFSAPKNSEYGGMSVLSRGSMSQSRGRSDGNDDNVMRSLVTIVVSLLKELIKHAQNIDVIVDLLGASLNAKVPDRVNNNIALLSAMEGLTSDSSDGEIRNMAEQIASIVSK